MVAANSDASRPQNVARPQRLRVEFRTSIFLRGECRGVDPGSTRLRAAQRRATHSYTLDCEELGESICDRFRSAPMV